MTSTTTFHDFQKYLPAVGTFNSKSRFAYKLTRGVTAIANMSQMALAESYIHGLEIPDFLIKGMFDAFFEACDGEVLGNGQYLLIRNS